VYEINQQVESRGRRTCVVQEFQTIDQANPTEELVIAEAAAEDGGAVDHEDEEANLEQLVGKPPGFPRRHNKKAPLDTSLLHRSARLEKINKGFNPSSASQSVSSTSQGQSSCKAKDKGKKPVVVDDPLYEGHSVPRAL
jgi:hypothetical protein